MNVLSYSEQGPVVALPASSRTITRHGAIDGESLMALRSPVCRPKGGQRWRGTSCYVQGQTTHGRGFHSNTRKHSMKTRIRRRSLLATVAVSLAVVLGSVAPISSPPAQAAWGGHSNGQIPASAMSSVAGHLFKTDAANSLAAMKAAYESALNRTLIINDGYRDLTGQWAAWNNYQNGGNLAAYPGTSNHGWGLAVDFGGEVYSSSNSVGHRWLQANAAAYGWKWTGRTFRQVENWHWEYVGGGSSTPTPVAAKRDVTGDARSDFLSVRNDGYLVYFEGNGSAGSTAFPLGPGWSSTTALVHGDFNGNGVSDLYQVRSNGDMYYYEGNGGTTFTPTYVGPGWHTLSLITGGEDFTGDGKPDVVARAADGNLYAYPGNGQGGLGNPVQIGTNWTGFTALVSGDFDQNGRGDLIARNSAGELWGYYGTANGLTTVQRLGQGWTPFSTIFGGGDYNGDGNPDLIARNGANQTLWLFPGTGGGFSNGVQIGEGWGAYSVIS